MKNKKILFIIVLVLIISIFISVNKYRKEKISGDENNDIIPGGYIAVFKGGSGEVIHETYIYKIDNGHENSGFEYINVTQNTKHWGSREWDIHITKRGSVQWTDDVFEIAKENSAYSYVLLPDSDKIYTIEEYRKIFLMN